MIPSIKLSLVREFNSRDLCLVCEQSKKRCFFVDLMCMLYLRHIPLLTTHLRARLLVKKPWWKYNSLHLHPGNVEDPSSPQTGLVLGLVSCCSILLPSLIQFGIHFSFLVDFIGLDSVGDYPPGLCLFFSFPYPIIIVIEVSNSCSGSGNVIMKLLKLFCSSLARASHYGYNSFSWFSLEISVQQVSHSLNSSICQEHLQSFAILKTEVVLDLK